MATNVDQLLIRVTVDADTGKLNIAKDDLKKLKEVSANAGQEVTKLEKKIQSASIAFERKQKAIRNVNDTIVKSSGLFNAFGGTLGQVSGHIFEVTNQLEDLEFASRKAGKSFDPMTATLSQATGAMGNLGVAALAAAAAFAGWKIGTFINDTLRLGDAIQSTADRLANFKASANDAGQSTESWYSILGNAVLNGLIPFKAYLETASAVAQVAAGSIKQASVNTDELGLALQKLHHENALAFQAENARKLHEALQQSLVDTLAQAESIKFKAGLSPQELVKVLQVEEDLAKVRFEAAKGTAKEKELEQQYAQAMLATANAEASVISQQKNHKTSTEKLTKAVVDLTAQYTALHAAMVSAASGASIAMTTEAAALGGAAKAATEMAIDSLDAARGVTSLGDAALDAARGIKELTAAEQANALAAGAAAAGADGLGRAASHLKDSILGAISAIGSAIGGITGQIANFGTSLVSIWTSAGTVWEKVFQSIAAGAQLLIGLFQKLFGHDWSKDVSRTLNGIQVSEQMFKQLVQDSKDLHNARVAVFLDLQAIIQDVGLTAQNVSQFIEQLRAGFSLLQEGVITTDQLIGVLNDTFQELANASMSSTGIISNQMKEIITLTHQFGLEVQSVTDFIQGQLTTAFQGFDYLFNRWADRMKRVSVPDVTGNIKFNNPSENKFDHFSKQIVMWINQMLASGMSIDQVMQLAGGDLDRLVQIAKEFGYSLDPSLKQMIALRQESEKWGGVINAVNSQLVAMANVFDTIDPKNFMEILKDARPVFKDILKDGKLTKAEWLSIMPLIMTILQFSQQFGIKVPKWVQQIIDLAQKKHWLPQDLDTTVNVHYKKMDADSLHVKDLIVTGASGGPTGGGGQVNAAGASRNRAGGAGGASQTIKIKDQRPIEIKNTTQLVLTNKGVIALAKEVAKVFESGQVTFNYTIGSIGTTLKG